MTLTIDVQDLPMPLLEFGTGEIADPKVGLMRYGPFSLRFGAAHKAQVQVGLVGPHAIIKQAQAWFKRCEAPIVSNHTKSVMYPDFPGFQGAFHSKLITASNWNVVLLDEVVQRNLILEPIRRFQAVLDLYGRGIERLANADVRPDVIVCCLPEEIITSCRTVTNTRLLIKQRSLALRQQKELRAGQMELFENEIIEEAPEDLLFRDFRRALKARAMFYRMPIQIGTSNLFLDSDTNQDPATRAWNVNVALFYKAGGIPWRLKTDGPETCFVGISFHHLRTKSNDLVYSSLAQAFSTEGDGFALRGDALPWTGNRERHTHLPEDQAASLARQVLTEYHERTGRDPARVVFHKTSRFDDAERRGFREALHNIPIVELVTLVQHPKFRLVKFGSYPPRRGLICTVNDTSTYVFTTGFVPEWGTYPGPHIPVPIQLIIDDDADQFRLASEVFGLSRMNWNTARDTSGYPITLQFARDVGAIMAEVSPHVSPNPSYRYYM
jgi:hypothetical protein